MSDNAARRAINLAWCSKAAHFAADAMVKAKALPAEQHRRAVDIATKEIFDLLAVEGPSCGGSKSSTASQPAGTACDGSRM